MDVYEVKTLAVVSAGCKPIILSVRAILVPRLLTLFILAFRLLLQRMFVLGWFLREQCIRRSYYFPIEFLTRALYRISKCILLIFVVSE